MLKALLAAMSALMCAGVGAAEYTFTPVPAWVTPVPVDTDIQPTEGKARQGVHYLLLDSQVLLDPRGKQQFRHRANRALNERGAESVAHVEISFDPSFETLHLHLVDVLRDGKRQPRLKTTPIKVLQRESQLESRIYDGSKTANLFLEDIRAGDIVEVAYTLRGSNPIFKEREFGAMDLQWSVPLAQMHRSITVPIDRQIQVRNHLTDLAPSKQAEGNWQRLTWTARDVPALVKESQTPAWFDPYPGLYWSEFTSWGEVARWAEPLYGTEKRISPAVRSQTERIAKSAEDDHARLLAVLRFVQKEIRYLGIEIGPGSHAPRDPDLVLRRRYGDCKDKTLLAIAMLRTLGIEAHAALVDTDARGAVRDMLPSPGAFNHVIVLARIGNDSYWLDPTREPQSGAIGRLTQANFGVALVLDGKSTALSDMPMAKGQERLRRIEQSFDAEQGFDKPVTMAIRTQYEGAAADRMRSTLRNEDREELQREYLNYYAKQYRGLTVKAPMNVADDEAANRLVLTESYLIPTFWEDSQKNQRIEGVFRVPDVRSLLQDPDETVRKAPYALNHPEIIEAVVKARLPEDWPRSTATDEFAHPAFALRFSKVLEGRDLRLEYRYESRKDHVPPEELPAFLDAQKRARSSVGLSLYKNHDVDEAAEAAPAATHYWALWGTLAAALLVLTRGGGLGWAGTIQRSRGVAPKKRFAARWLVRWASLSIWLTATGVTIAISSAIQELVNAGPWGPLAVFISIYPLVGASLIWWTRRSWPELALARCSDGAEELERRARKDWLWPRRMLRRAGTTESAPRAE